MQIRAKLAAVSGKSGTSPDAPNKIRLQLDPMYLANDDASWLFDHLGEYLYVDIEHGGIPPTPMEEAINNAPEVPAAGRRRNGTRSSEQA